MCGVFGFAGFREEGLIRRMADRLWHRGPDNTGFYEGADVSLGHTRLSIVDLSADGNQPMANEDRTVWTCVNGEVYNHQCIRDKLIRAGHVFRSRSDSEVVLHGYEEYGVDMLRLFNGMFAFALWDAKRRELVLARDRLGIKPIYYWTRGDEIMFASEIKAFLESERFERVRNEQALLEYLVFQNTFDDTTFFSHVHLLPPGMYLRWRAGRIRTGRYWDVELSNGKYACPEEAARAYPEKVRAAVRNHLMSDVPLACYLSGGFDSATVTQCVSEERDQRIRTFTGRFDAGPYYDESMCARAVADQTNALAREILIRPEDFLENIDDLVYCLDEPKVGMGAFSQYMVAREVAKEVKVVLTGHGGDELFAGYTVFKAFQVREDLMRRPLHALAALATVRPYELPYFVYFLLLSGLHPAVRLGLPAVMFRRELAKALDPDYYASVRHINPIDAPQGIAFESGLDKGDRVQYLYLKTYLPSLFVVEDKIGMAHSLESRTPLCDNDLVDFALSIPLPYKLAGGRSKYIVKEGMRCILPPVLYRQAKRGFPTPLTRWFRDEARDFVTDVLLGAQARQRGLFRPRYVEKLLKAHFRTKVETPLSAMRAQKIWMLLSVELWHRKFMDRTPPLPARHHVTARQ